jgi:predicted CoA-substrate-specific enzyme activase
MNNYYAGIDIGSTMTKVVIYGDSIVSSITVKTGAEQRRLANKVMKEALAKAKLTFDDITYAMATGYGRINVPFADRQITEITCHAKGIIHLFPSARTVIDIGGQDCKGIKLSEGKVVDFVMNDKCAAGTGRFLEVIAEALGVELQRIGDLSLSARNEVQITSICTVFAQYEVISKRAEGTAVEDILAGIHDSIATRVSSMVRRIGVQDDVVLTGGGALNAGLVKAMERKLNTKLLIPAQPLLTGALGAALVARELWLKAAERGAFIRKERVLRPATFYE